MQPQRGPNYGPHHAANLAELTRTGDHTLRVARDLHPHSDVSEARNGYAIPNSVDMNWSCEASRGGTAPVTDANQQNVAYGMFRPERDSIPSECCSGKMPVHWASTQTAYCSVNKVISYKIETTSVV
jgi:hypothetical protein